MRRIFKATNNPANDKGISGVYEMRIILVIFALILITGCSSPETPPAPVDTDTVTATDNSTVYQQMIDQLETILLKRNGQLEELQNRNLELEYKVVSLKTKDVLRQAEYQALIATMQAGYAEASATYSVDTEAMELMNEEMQKAESRLAIVQSNIDALMLGRVSEISANLTAAEYKIFRQGLEVWWWTFNEKEEKDGEE
ncbi:hypothetical protein LCGC14_2357850 [marine sediment metagenome]|uniref:Uncharacterized protein n=1 Tax=marine sediment metagenome TaxID=412755 RepID=A0A0F9CUR2_9ZZZZ